MGESLAVVYTPGTGLGDSQSHLHTLLNDD
jgi:hypothetical protein